MDESLVSGVGGSLRIGRSVAGVLYAQRRCDDQHLFQAAVAYYQGENLKDAKRLLAKLLDTVRNPDNKWFELMIAICVEQED